MQSEMKELLADIETERRELTILRSLIESCACAAEQEMRPNVLLQHVNVQSFDKFLAGLNIDEVV